jgi:adenylate kinase
VQLSTGDMLRAARASGSELGARVAAIMDAGSLVSDDIVIALIEEALAARQAAPGFVFDGFPRTVAQAEALDAMLARHSFAEEGRADDNPESYKVRLKAYLDQTAPLIPYYERQGKLVGVDGMADIDSVAAAIARVLEAA